MPSRRPVLATVGTALTAVTAGCSSIAQFQEPAGTEWTASVPAPAGLLPPSVTSNTLIAAGRPPRLSKTGRIVAFERGSGTQQWEHDMNRIHGFSVADGSVYVGERGDTRPARVLSFDAVTGEQQWTQPVNNLASSLTVADDTLYVANGTLAALDTTDGEIKWEQSNVDGFHFTVTAGPDDQLAADSEVVYFGGEGIVALSAADGSPLWSWNPDWWSWTDVGPTVTDSTVYAGGEGDVVAIDKQAGTELWQQSFGQNAHVRGICQPNTSVLVAEATNGANSFGTIYDLSARDGAERYEFRFDTPIVRTAPTTEGLIVGTEEKLAWAPDPPLAETPTVLLPADEYILGGTPDQAFVQSRSGKLWVISQPEE